MSRLRSAACLAVFALFACSHHGGPSPEYQEASARYTQLYAEKSEDAYTDRAMEDVVALLRRVPSGSSDALAAKDLLKTIQDGRTESRRRDEALKKDMAVLNAPPPSSAFTAPAPRPGLPTAAATAPAVEDAGGGPGEPAIGVSLADFQKKWGDCFEAGDPLNVIGVGLRDSWSLRDFHRCKDALPGFAERIVLTDGKSVVAVVPRSAVVHPPQPAPPPPAPAAPEADAG